ncbi:hypothetical protein [Deinococcus radiotolerans]|uniref:Uncharacterized protein n=1 Tax=Deinococcus radiotolerans TaxID=1309407 RepID=A0ABQ2FHR9_9DEIO|nr:hypothetical protein [Deinococcus radiotolerans]GGK97121.1 hypothetical protein GCM10010844_14340 [Deinococcus radiotolerans]
MTGGDWLDVLFPKNAERTVPWPPVEDVVTLWRPTGLHELQLVAAFDVRADVATRYAIQVVGAQDRHQELWVPAGELEAFNVAIVGPIRVVAHFAGPDFAERIDPVTHLPLD